MKEPGTHGSRWTGSEINQILDLFDAGATLDEIMPHTRRRPGAIIGLLVKEKRLHNVGIGWVRRDPFLYATTAAVERLKNPHEEVKHDV